MWTDTPTSFPAVPRIIVIGDVHGDASRLLEILYKANVINQNMQWIAEPKNTFVVQLGDQIDSISRGATSEWEKLPDVEVIQIMDRLDDVAKPHGGRVLSLLGNHELMNVMGDFSYVSAFSKAKVPMRAKKFAPNGQYGYLLSKRNVVMKVGDIIFCHGGLLPQHLDLVADKLQVINDVTRKYMRGVPMTQEELQIFLSVTMGDNGITWTRVYMDLLREPEKLLYIIDEVLRRVGAKMICIGHNTVNDVIGALGGRLWFVDNGISRCYGKSSFQFLEILNNGESYRIAKIDST